MEQNYIKKTRGRWWREEDGRQRKFRTYRHIKNPRSSRGHHLLHLHFPSSKKTLRFKVPMQVVVYMISSVSFINAHRQRAKPGLLFAVKRYGVPKFINRPIKRKHNQTLTLREFTAGTGTRVWDTCNGLILYGDPYNTRETFVTNPVTRYVMQLPPLPDHVNESILNPSFQHLFGLVYIACTGAYKVIHCFKGIFAENKDISCCDVLSLGGKSWKRLNIPFKEPREWETLPKIVFVNGVAHWIACEYFGYRRVILSLDIVEEKFYKTELPKYARYKEQLMEIQGRLCCISRISSQRVNYFQIWGMKDLYRGEWVKLHRVKLERPDSFDFVPCTSIANDKVIIFIQCVGSGGYSYVAYDVHTKRTRSVYRVKNLFEQEFPCYETLVSPWNSISE